MSVLDELVAGALEDQRTRELTVSLEDVKKATLAAPAPIDATRWLKRADGIPVIAEIKRASPSKGHLSDIPDPAALAREYEKGGASAISVLTEGRRFLGGLDDFDKVRAAVHIPVLRKDFIVTDYQIFEARAHGADLVLLIVAALDDAQLKHLLDLAHKLGMTVLVETHTREEIERARQAGAKVIGINARNLKNLKVDVNKYNELAADLPDDVIKVAESGVFGAVEVEDYARAGADAVLVGEGVATADNHELAVERLVKAGAQVKASETTPLSEHQGPYWGQFGGRYVPEALITALDELERVYTQAKADPEFHKEFMTLQQRYVGRPSPLTEAPRFAALVKEKTGLDARIFLKREDLNHTGAHKINNALGQALLIEAHGQDPRDRRDGRGPARRRHGARLVPYSASSAGSTWAPRIVERREASTSSGCDAHGRRGRARHGGKRHRSRRPCNAALRNWVTNPSRTRTTCSAPPRALIPFPTMVREFQKVIGEEARAQFAEAENGLLPDAVIACVGGGSNAIGVMNAFLRRRAREPLRLRSRRQRAPNPASTPSASRQAPASSACSRAPRATCWKPHEGQTLDTVLDLRRPRLRFRGPRARMAQGHRPRRTTAGPPTEEAMSAFRDLSQTEGIIPAIESSHAVAGAYKAAADLKAKGYDKAVMIVNISGRGDKDMATAGKWFGYLTDDQAAALDVTGTHGNTVA